MKQRIFELLKQCFDAGRYHQMKPFTTDLCGVYCPSFEQWCEDNKSVIATLFDSELATYKEPCADYMVMVNRKGEHTPHCWINQNWDEALQAMNDTPMTYRDIYWHEAMEDISNKMRTCNCGLDELRQRITELETKRRPFAGYGNAQ